MSEYDELLGRLYSLRRFGIKLSLKNIEEVLKSVGNPHIGAKGVHIAGTNGKGSVAAMISSILRSAGYRTGTYTSPHLLNFEERIVVDGKPIDSRTLMEYITSYLELAETMNKNEIYPTFFEIATAIAFDYFHAMGAEVWVIETGMGGRLDATNILELRTGVISSIGMDHTEHLGNSLKKIASEKSGIIKPGMKVVTGEKGDILKVIEKRASDIGAEVFALGRDFDLTIHSISIDGVECTVKGIYDEYRLKVPLTGRHQGRNASLSVVSAELMRYDGISIDINSILSGISSTVWRGRFDIVSGDPLIIMDAAHNPSGALALRETLIDTKLWGNYTLVMGMLSDKDADMFSKILMKGAVKTIITEPKYKPRAMKMEELMKITSKYGDVEGINNPRDAVLNAIGYGKPVVITGSIYLLGDILNEIDFDNLF